jgi:acyl-CoA synthetase (AMP-forming)/AMP-acid ligase II
MTFLDVLARNLAGRADHPFILHAGRRLTYVQFDRLTNRAAHALRRLGVAPGDRVTLALGNSLDWVAAAFGALKSGAIVNPLNPGLGPGELRYVLGHAEPRVVVTNADSGANILAVRDAVSAGCTIAAFGGVPGVTDFDELIAAAPETPPGVAIGPRDPALLLYTSGTTGKPKGVLTAHGSTGVNGNHFIAGLGITPADTLLFVTPLFHGNAWGALMTAFQAGCTAAFPVAFRASEFWSLAHETRATVLFTLGTILAMLLTREPSEQERTSRLRVILGLGSAPIRDAVIRRLGVAHVAECFGSTDAGVVTLTPLGTVPRPGSAGPPVAGVTIRIVDDAGYECPPRGVGEITIRSPYRMLAYFRDPEQTAEALHDDWFLTGDLGFVDEDGWLYFVDRKKDIIRRGGENVSSLLVEKAIAEHPRVVEAAVIGVPDPVLGQEIKAYVVTNAPVSEEELRTFVAGRLARFQMPRLWEFRDALPKTPTQRVEKYKLRAEHGGGRPLLG